VTTDEKPSAESQDVGRVPVGEEPPRTWPEAVGSCIHDWRPIYSDVKTIVRCQACGEIDWR
jgi:hypothetical protein